MKSNDFRIARNEAETVVVADVHEVVVYTTNPSHWRALRRRVAKLGGRVENIQTVGRREVAGTAIFPPEAFSLARFGLRASPAKAKAVTHPRVEPNE